MVSYRDDNFQINVRQIRQSKACHKCGNEIPVGSYYVDYRLLERGYADGFWNQGCQDCFIKWARQVCVNFINILTSVRESRFNVTNVVNDLFDINGGANCEPIPEQERRFHDMQREQLVRMLLLDQDVGVLNNTGVIDR